jgi:hypothetical protein
VIAKTKWLARRRPVVPRLRMAAAACLGAALASCSDGQSEPKSTLPDRIDVEASPASSPDRSAPSDGILDQQKVYSQGKEEN